MIDLLLQHGFRQGAEPYQLVKNLEIASRSFPVRLDLLKSRQHHDTTFIDVSGAPLPAAGTEYAFRNNSLESIGPVALQIPPLRSG